MKNIPRRTAIGAGCATVAMILAKTEAVVADPRLDEIQALITEIRNVGGQTPVGVYVALQEVADRLEALPGISPVHSEEWDGWKLRLTEQRANSEWPIGPYLPARAGELSS